ncbi:MEMO1 protein [Cunninghamella echinulata]|nr:MEMO1 protein [Cunninghamella echinulata]
MNRSATHAGSWYTNSKTRLNSELEKNLIAATVKDTSLPIKDVRAIIAPHAGYSYSGPTAAYAYKSINVSNIKRVFILGPSHHVYLDGCALSKYEAYDTPLGSLTLDHEVISELYLTKQFTLMSKSADEDEHSIEMHLPYIFKIFEKKINDIKIIPILVGSIHEEKEDKYGKIFGQYLSDPSNLFIVSSDFCHWGERFRYTYYQGKHLHRDDSIIIDDDIPIYKSIEQLDQTGIKTIESLDVKAFRSYLNETQNTICGRHPICVLMAALHTLNDQQYEKSIQFIKYAQSSPCHTIKDSSVSYASAYITILNK